MPSHCVRRTVREPWGPDMAGSYPSQGPIHFMHKMHNSPHANVSVANNCPARMSPTGQDARPALRRMVRPTLSYMAYVQVSGIPFDSHTNKQRREVASDPLPDAVLAWRSEKVPYEGTCCVGTIFYHILPRWTLPKDEHSRPTVPL